MIIGCFNVDNKCIIDELNKDILLNTVEIKPDSETDIELDAIFLNWIKTDYDKKKQNKGKLIIKQTELLEEYTKKKKPIIIFDSEATMSEKEYQWLKKFNVKFFEPYVNYRKGFEYLPFWLKLKNLDEINFNKNPNRISLGYKGSISDKIKQFEKYYVSESYGGLEINYDSEIRHENNYINYNIVKKDNIDFNNFKITVLINNHRQNMYGYLHSDFIKALECNCIPLIPRENRYYQGFENIVNEDFDVWYNIKSYDLCYIGIIYQIYEDIKKYYPEMNVMNTVNILKSHFINA